MEIILAPHRGFCYGVKRAIGMALEQAGHPDVYTLGPLIHNPQMVAQLRQQGIKLADSLDDIAQGTVILRSHGVEPVIYEQAAAKGLRVIDAACPNVRRAQDAAVALLAEGRKVVVIGEGEHPEVISIVGWCKHEALVVGNEAEAAAVPFTAKLGIVSQTTFAEDKFKAIISVLRQRAQDVKVIDTICNATAERQQAAVATARACDVMLVIGGHNSANTTHLAELCRAVGVPVHHIEIADEIDMTMFKPNQKVGVTAGASTPDWLIEEVCKRMEEVNEQMNADAPEGVLTAGSIVSGKVISVTKDEAFVDVGYKGEGVIPLTEIAYPVPENTAEVVSVGAEINVYVMNADNTDGPIKLSKVQADRLLAWDAFEKALAAGTSLKAVVTEAVKGGLAIAVNGLRGFVPASKVDLHYVEDLTQFVKQTIEVLPLEIDREKNRAVFSRRDVLMKERAAKEAAIYDSLHEGDKVKGIVRRLTNFGAFVDIGGVDGLVHISDLSWKRVKSPEEVVKVGEEVVVLIQKVDKDAKRISLNLKAAGRDPWFDAVLPFKENAVVKGKVTKLAKFGAFVELAPDVEGLVHVSELADRRVASPDEVVNVGQEVAVKILSIDTDTKKIALSMSKAQQDAQHAEFQQYIDNQQDHFHMTLGDKFGYLFKNTNKD